MKRVPLTIALILALVSGCSSQQLYSTGQSYQRNQCNNLPGPSARERCLSGASGSYDVYRRETGDSR